MAPDQAVLGPDDEDVYAAPDAARLGTVEELTEGTTFTLTIGDQASEPTG